jgi:IclR family mhp operon transcriptional activator
MDALTVLSMTGRITAAELAKKIGVPRTTAHRILDTLVADGYVFYNPHNHCFQLGQKIRRLAQGFTRDELISEVARPILRDLCHELLFPVGLITPVGNDLMLQVATDSEAPLALAQLPEGFYFPATYGAVGRLYLAHCTPDARKKISAAADASAPTYLKRHTRPSDDELDRIRSQGYAVSAQPGAPAGILVVPVFAHGNFVASVHIRFGNYHGAAAEAVERYLDHLKRAAREIEAGLARQGN